MEGALRAHTVNLVNVRKPPLTGWPQEIPAFMFDSNLRSVTGNEVWTSGCTLCKKA